MIRSEEMGIGQVAHWFFGAAERWPETFEARDLGQLWTWAHEHVYEQGQETESERRRLLVQALRAGLLKRARAACNHCTGCDLHRNRLPSRPVYDDGDLDNDLFARWENNRAPIGTTSAEILVLGEGPDAFEQRTGFPFVSYQGLAGASVCAYACANYDGCFNSQSKLPQGECQPVMLRKTLKEQGAHPDELEGTLLQIRTERANAPVFSIQTAGNCLDKVIFKAGLWREVWNSRARLQGKEPRIGTVYVTNVVKCRATDSHGKDTTPSKKAMDACHEWLEQQLYIIQPKVIIALGNAAIRMATGLEEPKVLSRRGEVHPSPWMAIPVVVDVHPSYIIRQEDKAKQEELTGYLVESFELAKRVAAGEVGVPEAHEAVEHECPPMAELTAVCAKPLVTQVTTREESFLDEEEDEAPPAVAGAPEEEEPHESDEGTILPSQAKFVSTEPEDGDA